MQSADVPPEKQHIEQFRRTVTIAVPSRPRSSADIVRIGRDLHQHLSLVVERLIFGERQQPLDDFLRVDIDSALVDAVFRAQSDQFRGVRQAAEVGTQPFEQSL